MFRYETIVLPSNFEENFNLIIATQSGRTTAFTEEPNGQLDFDKLQKRDPKCWRSSITQDSFKRKKIIITDWSFGYGGLLEQRIYCDKLSLISTLLDKGYEFYIWQENRPYRLENMTEIILALENIEAIKEQDIKNYLELADEFDLFTFQKMETMVRSIFNKFLSIPYNFESNMPSLYMDCFLKLSKEQLSSILATINDSTDIGFTIEHDDPRLQLIIDQIINKKISITTLTLRDNVFKTTLKNNEALKLSHILTPAVLDTLKSLNVTTPHSFMEFYHFLEQNNLSCEKLKKVTIYSCHVTKSCRDISLNYNDHCLPHLKKIVSKQACHQQCYINKLPKQLEKLKHNFFEKLILEKHPYSYHIKKAQINPNIYTETELGQIAENFPHINTLAMNSENPNMSTFFDNLNISNLHITHTVSLEAVNIVLDHNKDVESLAIYSINNSKLLRENIQRSKAEPSSLISLKIDKVDNPLILNGNNLPQLGMISMPTNMRLDSVLIGQINYLNIHAGRIKQADQLMYILKYGKNLKCLNCEIEFNDNIDLNWQSNIESLAISGVITTETLFRILNRMPNLKRLFLKKIICQGESLEELKLDTLEILDIIDCNFESATTIYSLLSKNNKLKELFYNSKINVENDFTNQSKVFFTALSSTPETLKNLFVFKATCDDTYTDLSFIGQNCKNLRILSLQHNRRIRFESILKELKDMPHLRELFLKNIIIKPSLVAQILNIDMNSNNPRIRNKMQNFRFGDEGKYFLVKHAKINDVVYQNCFEAFYYYPDGTDLRLLQPEVTLDNRTGERNNYDVTEYFKLKEKNVPFYQLYRLRAYQLNPDTLRFKSKVFNFKEYNGHRFVDDLKSLYDQEYANDKFHYLGEFSLFVTNEWTLKTLPSLDGNEKLKFIEIANKDAIEIGYDQGFYSLRLKPGYPPQQIHLKFIIQVSSAYHDFGATSTFDMNQKAFEKDLTQFITSNFQQLPESFIIPPERFFNNLAAYFGDQKIFGFGDLEGLSANPSIEEIFNAIMSQKKGACRHRAHCFAIIAEKYLKLMKELQANTQVRELQTQLHKDTLDKLMITYISNDLHAMVEIGDGDKFKLINLGGSPANNINVNQFKQVEANKMDLENDEERRAELNTLVSESTPEPISNDNKYITWNHHKTAVSSPENFVTSMLNEIQNGPVVNRLIVVPSKAEIESLNQLFKDFMMAQKCNYFFTNITDIMPEFSQINHVAIAANDTTYTITRDAFDKMVVATTKRKRDPQDSEPDVKNHKYFTKKQRIVSELFKNTPSAMVKFVQQTNNSPYTSMILIDWTGHKASHIGFNSILLEPQDRRLYNQPLSPQTQLFIVMTEADAANMGEDFYNHIDAVYPLPFKTTSYPKSARVSTPVCGSYPIQLYNDANWQNIILGKLTFHNNLLQEWLGKLWFAILNNYPGVEFINPPWHDPSFCKFYDELQTKEIFVHNQREYNIPHGFKISYSSKPYELRKVYRLSVWDSDSPTAWDLTLNVDNYDKYFMTYHTKNNMLLPDVGLLATQAPLKILVTSSLRESLWEKWLDEVEEQKATVELIFIDSDFVPALLRSQNVNEKSVKLQPGMVDKMPPLNKVDIVILQSNDIDMLIASCKNNYKPGLIVPISETTLSSDLIERFHLSNGIQENGIPCEYQINTIWQALQQDETVILHGKISSELALQLQTLFNQSPFAWVNGKKEKLLGRLIIATDSEVKEWLPFKKVLQRQFSQEEIETEIKKEYPDYIYNSIIKLIHAMHQDKLLSQPLGLKALKSLCDECLAFRDSLKMPMPIAIRKAAKRQFRLDKNASNINQWLNKSYPEIYSKKPDLSKYKRFDRICMQLTKQSAFAFMVGPSGSGKTTFAIDQLPELWQARYKVKMNLHVGLDAVLGWLTSTDKDGDHTLFLDEANLLDKASLDFLAGFFNVPPGILYQGKLYPIRKHHKVLIAMNYSHYANRHIYDLFLKHGHIEHFKALTRQDLFEDTIRPIYNELFTDEKELKRISEFFLDIYTTINSKTNSMLTPRNLATIMLRLATYIRDYAAIFKGDTYNAALIAAYEEIRPYLSKDLKNEVRAKINKDLDLKKVKQAIKEDALSKFKFTERFKITKSREGVFQRLYDQLQLRKLRIDKTNLRKEGTRATVIEGDSGIGKSVLVIEGLRALGYKEITDIKAKPPADGNYYYYLTPTNFEHAEAILLKAFDDGAIVVVDELNSLTALESLLNDLLSGRHKEQVATKEGFMLIGTQNPPNKYKNRQKLSVALANRSRVEPIKDYPENELVKIVAHKLGDEDKAKAEVNNYQIAKSFAAFYNKNPEPTPRVLFRKARLNK